ncbi:MAG: hypothetical protein AAGM22_16515 [Acidobacteriota bacterium]
MKSYSTRKTFASKRTATALAPLLLLGLTSAGPAAGAGDTIGPATGLGDRCEAKLRCDVGRSLYYDYAATFIGDADVQTASEHGYGSATITGAARVEIAAVESRSNQCTYAVALSDVALEERVQGEVVMTPKGEDVEAALSENFYFTQRDDGQLIEVVVGREDLPETATFKRGIVNALNMTIQDRERYEVMETDISGTHLATYSLTEVEDKAVLSRTLTKGSDRLLKGQVEAFNYEAQQQTSLAVDLNACHVSEVNISESVVVTEPGPGDPAVSNVFRHDTLTVQASALMRLVGAGAPTNAVTVPTKSRLDNMVRIPVNAPVSESSESFNGADRVESLLVQLRDDPSNEQLISELGRTLPGDRVGQEAFVRFVNTEQATGDLAHSLGMVAIGVGSPQAQRALGNLLSSAILDESTRERLVGLSVMMDLPTPGLVKVVSRLAQDTHLQSGAAATLVLGAYANKLANTQPMLAAGLVEGLSQELATAGPDLANLYLRALGNAGAESSLKQIATFLNSVDRSERLSAVVAMRWIDSPRVDELLVEQIYADDSKSVQQAIVRVVNERLESGLADAELPALKTIILDWNWSETYGSNFINTTLSASTLVDSEPYIVDVQANAVLDGSWIDPQQLLNVQLLTEPTTGNDRRFRFFVNLIGFDIANITQVETCSIDAESTLWDESIKLFGLSSPPIPIIGPLTLKLTLEIKIEFRIDWVRKGEWCSANGEIELGMTPGVGLVADGYATLTLLFVRGGIGAAGELLTIELPVYAQADMNFQDASDVCFVIDAVLKAGTVKIYAWGQVWIPFRGWRPKDRAKFTIWEYTIYKTEWNLVEECESNPNLQCLPDVFWWDGTTIDATYDGANCFVTSPPPGGTPFIANNSYYLSVNSTCPAGMPFDGIGCIDETIINVEDVGYFLFPASSSTIRLVMVRQDPNVFIIPPCPNGWTQTQANFQSRTCERTAPTGFSASDFFIGYGTWQNTIYVDGSGTCAAGNLDSTGCLLGNAPGGTNAFILSNGNFYYSEP